MDTLSMPLLRASDSFSKEDHHHLFTLEQIAPPSAGAIPVSIEETSSESNSEDVYAAYASGSGSASTSTSSFSTGQLTPPFSSCSCSSSLNIADHHHHRHNHEHEEEVLDDDADSQEGGVDDSIHTTTRNRQATTTNNKTNPSKHRPKDTVSRSDVRRYAAEIVRREAKALLDLASRLDPEAEQEDNEEDSFASLKSEKPHDDYSKAIEILKNMDSHGRIIMTGVGKSGLLARKAVATFNSFGIPSAFLHPVEALHGDLGSLSPYGVDTVILISYSGRTTELLHLLNHLRQRRVYACISLSTPDSALAEACDVNIDVSLENDEEAEDSVPAPTSSVVTALAALDALALTLLRFKTGWHSHISERRKAFGLHHPGGSLGQQLSSTLEQT